MATRSAAAVCTIWTAVLVSQPASAQTIELIMNELAAVHRSGAASQKRVNRLHEDSQDMLARYRQALAETDSFKKYNEQLAGQVTSQAGEIATIKKQLAEIEVTARDILPLMKKMVDTLETFVALDVPFLLEERKKRVSTLKSILPRADVSISEKYRRILEAYEIEMEYGRTLEAYDGKLEDGGTAKTVEFIRLGRVSLTYRTLDGQETGYWDANQKAWVQNSAYAHAVREALRVAKKQGAPDLLFMPVPAPRQVSP